MTSPDAAAAATVDPHPVQANALMHEKHIGASVEARDTAGILKDFAVTDHGVSLSIQQEGRPYVSAVTVNPDEPVRVVEEAPPSPYDEHANAEVPEHVVYAREMAQISDELKLRKGEVEGLEDRYKTLSDKLMAYYETVGDRKLPFDGRSANLRIDTFAQYKDKPADEGGGRYTNAEVVEVLRKIGREGDIMPESVLPSVLAAILREYRDSETPVPPELDAVVKLGERYRVTITKPSPGRR